MNNIDFTILGCGMSGMVTALSLADKGFQVAIVDKLSIKNISLSNLQKDNRTTALNHFSEKYLSQINIWHILEKNVSYIRDIYVVDNKDDDMLHLEYNQAQMGCIIKNSILRECLRKLVVQNANIRIIDDHSYHWIDINKTNGIISIFLTHDTILKTRLLILCDGYKSLAKKLFFHSKIDKNYEQIALTFDVKHALPHEGTAVEHFMPEGPLAILPLTETNKSSVVWTVSSNFANEFKGLSKQAMNIAVQNVFGNFLGSVEIVSVIQLHELKGYLTSQYYFKNIVVLGDTAHIVHPLAGQGFNQAIKDIESLLYNIEHYGISENALMRYSKARKHDNETMFEITNMINKMFSNNVTILRILRKFGFNILNKYPKLLKYISKYGMGLV